MFSSASAAALGRVEPFADASQRDCDSGVAVARVRRRRGGQGVRGDHALSGGLAANREPRMHMRPRGSCHSFSSAWNLSQRARDRLKIVIGELLGDFRVIPGCLLDQRVDVLRELSDFDPRLAVDGRRLRVGFACNILIDFRAIGVCVGDALEALAGYAFAYGRIDADFRAGRNDAGRHDGRLGSSGFARAPGMIKTSRSPCTRVAIAHSTSIALNTSMSSSTTTTCFEIHHRERREQRVLAFAGLLSDRDDRVPERAAAERDVDVVHLHAGVLERGADRRIARRRGEPGVFPRHVQRIINRVPAHA